MDKTLRILILEDNKADAELIQFELEEGGVAFTAKVVTSEEDFLHGLRAFSPDIILSDYDLPRYTGAFALAEAKNRCPDLPFILVTGAVTEDRAIEILTGGAKDYVMKSRLNRLVPAVRRALAEAEEHRARKMAEQELRAASLYARTLIEASLDPLVTISPDGKVMDVNRATEEVTGVCREQIIGTDFANYFTEPEKARAGYERVFSTGSVKDYPLALRHRSGRITEVLYNSTTYTSETGEVQGVFAAARDVTELKRVEEDLRKAHRDLEAKARERMQALEAEIGERRQTEKALRQSEERQRRSLRAEQAGRGEAADREPGCFRHAASQDLCAPLRTIDGCTRAILAKQGAAFDAETRKRFDQILDSTRAMQELIEDLPAGGPGKSGNGETPPGA
ncbi:MAG: PAS domain S-box protein [Syntrophales bacterium]